METQQKAINFDLDTNQMKGFFADYTKGYFKIRKAFTQNGFEHEQGSGYISKEKLKYVEVIDIIRTIVKAEPWFYLCCKKFLVTDIEAVNESRLIIENAAPKKLRDQKKTQEKERADKKDRAGDK